MHKHSSRLRKVRRRQKAIDQFKVHELVLHVVELQRFADLLLCALEEAHKTDSNSVVIHVMALPEMMDSVGLPGNQIYRISTVIDVWAVKATPKEAQLPVEEVAKNLVDFINLIGEYEY